MARDISAGIDIGTHHVKVVIGERVRENGREFPRVIGTGYAESKGLRHGYVIEPSEAAASVKAAVADAAKNAEVEVKRAFLGVGGVGIEGVTGTGAAVVSRGDGEITELDVEKAEEEARLALAASAVQNRRIIHAIPLEYRIDNKLVFGNRPVGLKGLKLEVRMFFVTCLEQHFGGLIAACEEAGIEVEDVMASPLASSVVSLTKAQKIAGAVLANIGAETVSIVVYENGTPTSLEVFPFGSTDITNDIALGLKISLDEAEQIKLGALTETAVPKKKYDDIISARLSDIFDLIEEHLKKIHRNGLLPAGIVLTGGGGNIALAEELAKTILKLPARVSMLMTPAGSRVQVKDSSWSVAYGLSLWGFTGEGGRRDESGDLGSQFKRLFKTLGRVLKPLLP